MPTIQPPRGIGGPLGSGRSGSELEFLRRSSEIPYRTHGKASELDCLLSNLEAQMAMHASVRDAAGNRKRGITYSHRIELGRGLSRG
jgi:hypothetical protein